MTEPKASINCEVRNGLVTCTQKGSKVDTVNLLINIVVDTAHRFGMDPIELSALIINAIMAAKLRKDEMECQQTQA